MTGTMQPTKKMTIREMKAAKALSIAAKRGLARAPKSDTLVVYAYQDFQETSLDLIIAANEVIAKYSGSLSLRQLYYRLVAGNVFANTLRIYKNFGEIVKDARNAGLIDWEAIEDRGRTVHNFWHYLDPGDAIRSAAESYLLDLWADQEVYV